MDLYIIQANSLQGKNFGFEYFKFNFEFFKFSGLFKMGNVFSSRLLNLNLK